MLLASVADIRDDLGFDDMTDVNASIAAALNAAEAQLASDLGTVFESQNYQDTFYVSEPCFERGNAVLTELKLGQGFVSAITSIAVQSSLDGSGDYFNYQPQLSYGNTNTDASYTTWTTDLVRGVMKNTLARFRGQFVIVNYQCGLAPDPNNVSSFDLTKVPQWLQEAAKLRAKIFLSDADVVTEANIKIDTRLLNAQLKGSLSKFSRYAPSAILPLDSVLLPSSV